MFTILDIDGTVIYASPSVRDTLDVAPDELVGNNVFSFFHPDDVDEVRTAFGRAVRSADSTPAGRLRSFRFRHADGSWRLLETVDGRLRDGSDVPSIVVTARDVTERRRQEEQIALLAAIVDSSDDAIMSTDLDTGQLVSWNRGASDMTGYSADEMLGGSPFRIVPEDQHQRAGELHRRVTEGESLRNEDLVVQRKDGGRLESRTSFFPVRADNGEMIGRAMIIRDVTDRIEQERQLARLAAIVEASDDAILSTDVRPMRTTSWNRGAEEMFGYSAEEAIGTSPVAIIPADRLDETARMRQMVQAGESLREVATVLQRKNGTRFDAQTSWFPIPGPDGEPVGHASVIRDVSDRVAAQRALAESEARNVAIVDNLSDGVIVIDREGTMQSANAAASRIFGWAPEDFVGRNVSALAPEPDRSNHDSYLRRYLDTGEARIIDIGREVIGERRGGTEFPLELHLTEVLDGPQHLFVGVVRDLTDRKAAEETTERLAAVVRGSGDAIFSNKIGGEITSWNEGAALLYGCTEEEAIGMSLNTTVPPERAGEFEGLTGRLAAGEDVRQFETVRRRKDGTEIPVSVTLARFEFLGLMNSMCLRSFATSAIVSAAKRNGSLRQKRGLASMNSRAPGSGSSRYRRACDAKSPSSYTAPCRTGSSSSCFNSPSSSAPRPAGSRTRYPISIPNSPPCSTTTFAVSAGGCTRPSSGRVWARRYSPSGTASSQLRPSTSISTRSSVPPNERTGTTSRNPFGSASTVSRRKRSRTLLNTPKRARSAFPSSSTMSASSRSVSRTTEKAWIQRPSPTALAWQP